MAVVLNKGYTYPLSPIKELCEGFIPLPKQNTAYLIDQIINSKQFVSLGGGLRLNKTYISAYKKENVFKKEYHHVFYLSKTLTMSKNWLNILYYYDPKLVFEYLPPESPKRSKIEYYNNVNHFLFVSENSADMI